MRRRGLCKKWIDKNGFQRGGLYKSNPTANIKKGEDQKCIKNICSKKNDTVQIKIAGAVNRDGERYKGAYCIWYGSKDPRNVVKKYKVKKLKSNLELYAVRQALRDNYKYNCTIEVTSLRSINMMKAHKNVVDPGSVKNWNALNCIRNILSNSKFLNKKTKIYYRRKSACTYLHCKKAIKLAELACQYQ